MKRLTINWHDLELAFDAASDREFLSEWSDYFDRETGEVIFLGDELTTITQDVIEELEETLEQGADWTDEAIRATEAFQQAPQDERASLLAAVRIESGESDRFAIVPPIESHEAYRWMRDFADSVSDDAARNRLSRALDGRSPFRRFREAMAGDRRLEHKWRQFEADCQHETIVEWLDSIGVEPANPEVSGYEPPPLPDLRGIMLAEVRQFVVRARDIPGVRRIALIGSLTTAKEFPKDLDLLVTVSDDCDLAPLAKLGRRLTGEMLKHQAGADVFLADEGGVYLGRTCPWKKCGPGYRVSCDALHCGQRRYLHDDLNAVRLKKALIADPPVRLWPEPAASQQAPPDVREQLIEKLTGDEG
jgi:hypothetical protein